MEKCVPKASPRLLFTLRENTELFLVHIFLVFWLNTEIYGPEITPYLHTFHAVLVLVNSPKQAAHVFQEDYKKSLEI